MTSVCFVVSMQILKSRKTNLDNLYKKSTPAFSQSKWRGKMEPNRRWTHYLITIRKEAILDIILVAVNPFSVFESDLHEHQHHLEQVQHQHQHHRRHQDQHQHHQYPNELNRRSNSFWVMVVAAGQGAKYSLWKEEMPITPISRNASAVTLPIWSRLAEVMLCNFWTLSKPLPTWNRTYIQQPRLEE